MSQSRLLTWASSLAVLMAACGPTEAPSADAGDADAPPGDADDAPPFEPARLAPPGVPLDLGPRMEAGPEEMAPPGSLSDPGAERGLCRMTLDCGVEIPNEPKVPCHFRVVDDRGILWYDGSAGVELRGRSSLRFPKHQYAVELWDDSGADLSADLLGFGEDEDWVVNGAWIDRALMRNQFAFDTFRGMGGWAPQSSPCTLTLDGAWLGIYFLTERPRRGSSRMDFPSSATGEGFIAVLDDGGGAVDFAPAGHGTWRLVYPRQENATEEQLAGATAWLRGWKAAIQAPDVSDPETGVLAWVDRDSAIDFILLEELVKNNDAFYLSVFVWKTPGGRLLFTPWDLDLSIGQPIYNNNVPPEEWIRYRPPWVARMAELPGFREALAARWFELREGLLSDEAVIARVESIRARLGDRVYDNFEVWPIEEIQFARDQLPVVSSFDEEYARVLAWLPARLAWIDAHIADW